MQISRHTGADNSARPYALKFEVTPDNNFHEAQVAANALSLTPYEQEWLGFSDQQALEWALLSAHIHYRGDKEAIAADLETVKLLGSSLLYFSGNTKNELFRGTPSWSRQSFAIRRIEGDMALRMVEKIKRRNINIPAVGPRNRVVGFSR